jgi:hypothetical protein
MITIDEIRNDMMLEEFNECYMKCSKCSAYISLKQASVSTKGEISFNTVSEMAVDVDALPNLYNTENTKVIFLRITTQSEPELKKIYSFWETLLERSTEMERQNRKNDYIFTIDLVKTENEDTVEAIAYTMSYTMPNRVYPEFPEYGSLMLEFDVNNMRFEKVHIDMVAVNNELEYAEEVERQNAAQESMKKPAFGEKEYQENSDVIDNDDYLL